MQEKLDGANVSVRVADECLVPENRGKPVSSHPQFDPFKAWVAAHPGLHDLDNLILYGEWLYAEHGTPYNRLPDYFIAYDLYDTTTETFCTTDAVQEYCAKIGITAKTSYSSGHQQTSRASRANHQSSARPPCVRGCTCASKKATRASSARNLCATATNHDPTRNGRTAE
ncbi:MAG: RNA ligase family protein [Thermoanaerobaculia bacterium]